MQRIIFPLNSQNIYNYTISIIYIILQSIYVIIVNSIKKTILKVFYEIKIQVTKIDKYLAKIAYTIL